MAATPAGDDFSRYGGTTTSIPKFDVPEAAEPARPRARYNPRGWSIRKRFLVGGGIVTCLAIIGIVVGAVLGTRRREENYYDYSVYRPLGYTLVDEYTPSNFFDRFDYYSDVDPTEGFVDYVDGPTARALNLTSATASSAILRVDASTANATRGRRSVRLESTTAYDRGLFVFDIVHTPYGCGTWPALWLTDPAHWPEHGEIDVLETTNRGSEGNAVTLHTGGKCVMDGERRQEGTAGEYVNCDNSTHSNAGCGVEGGSGTYGEEMNAGGGGVCLFFLLVFGATLTGEDIRPRTPARRHQSVVFPARLDPRRHRHRHQRLQRLHRARPVVLANSAGRLPRHELRHSRAVPQPEHHRQH